MYLLLAVGVPFWSLFWFASLCVLSSFALILAGSFALIVILMPCDCWCSVVLLYRGMGQSAVCDCGIC